MNIKPINTISFKGKIIDAHVHHGRWGNGNFTAEHLDRFIKSPLNISINGVNDTDTIEKVIISSLNAIGTTNRLNETDGLNESIKMFGNNPKVGILAVAQPNLTEGNCEQFRQAIESHPDNVIGIKFHPTVLKEDKTGKIIEEINPLWYDPYLKLASERNLPCLFHSDGTFSQPHKIYELAQRHKDTPIILGHCGGKDKFEEALAVLLKSVENKDSRIYCDISWLDWELGKDNLAATTPEKVIRLIRTLKEKPDGLERILFGTDAPLGCYGEHQAAGNIRVVGEKEAYETTVSNLKSAIKNHFGEEAETIINKIFYENANSLFFNRDWAKQTREVAAKTAKEFSKTKAGIIIGLAIATIGGAIYTLKNKSPKK